MMQKWKNSFKRYFIILIALVLMGTSAIAMQSDHNTDNQSMESDIENADYDSGENNETVQENAAESYIQDADVDGNALADSCENGNETPYLAEKTDADNKGNDNSCIDITYTSDTVSEVADTSGIMNLLADTWNPAQENDTNSQFAMKRLVLISDEIYDDYDAVQILHYEEYDEYVLQFDTAEAAEAAYYEMVDVYGETSCFPDELVTADELWEADDEYSYNAETYSDTIDTVTDISVDTYDTWGAAYMGMDYLKAQMKYADIDRKIKIAVIDSGVDDTHSKFDGRIDYSTSCYIFKENNVAASNYDFKDGLGHGTHVSGTIADCTPDNVSLMVIKTFDDSGNSSVLAITTAMQYAIENNASVMNMSLGWFSENAANYTFLDTIITQAKNRGIVICAAAGNQAGNVMYAYPAHNEDVITVTAITSSGYFATSYSNYGSVVDFCAPGTSIYNTYANGAKVTASGTSMATPHVTSAVAYVMLAEPGLTVDEIENRLKEYAVDLGDAGWDNKYGYGCINLHDYFNDLKLPVKEMSTATSGDADITIPAYPEMKFQYHSLVQEYQDTGVSNKLITNSDGTITYTSSNTSVAAVDRAGNLTINGRGSCKITATVSETENYQAATLSYNITVTPKDISDCYVVLPSYTYYYTGLAIKPSVKLKSTAASSSYLSSAYYTVAYDNNISLGTGIILIRGIGNYTGELIATFNITLASTSISTLANSATGVSIKWNKVTGATGYIVYRKTATGSWARLKVISGINNISYVDTTAISGVSYYYLVRPVNGSTLGGYGNYRLIKRLSQPSFTRVNTSSGICLSWSKVNGASGYMIYRKANNATAWTLIKTVSSSVLSYTDTAVTIGNKYTYTVKAYSGSYYSSWHLGAAMYRMTGRAVYYSTNNGAGKLYLKWYSDNYVTGYQVAYSTDSTFSSFKYVTIPGNKVNYTTLSNLTKGRYYYIKVRSYRTVNGVTYCSNWGNAYKVYISK